MDSPNDIASRIMAAIAALPPQEQADAIHSLIGGLLKQMPIEGILQMREEIASQFEEEVPIVSSTCFAAGWDNSRSRRRPPRPPARQSGTIMTRRTPATSSRSTSSTSHTSAFRR